MAPFHFSGFPGMLVFLGIGIAFGFTLERAGFADARRMAAQFYLYDMRVLKVMFTAIVTAMMLIFWGSALGWVAFERIWVPPTYLWPGILGGLLLGMGFIIGGYCPGTSLVSMATLKIDGAFFVAGTFLGMFAFGETIPRAWTFWHESGSFGRLTLSDWLGVDAGVVVIAVVLMALGAFWAAEWAERRFRRGPAPPLSSGLENSLRLVGVVLFIAAGLGLSFLGQPSASQRVVWASSELDARLQSRQVHLDPAEVLDLMYNNQLDLVLVDVRSESDYNLFHLTDARLVSVDDIDLDWTGALPAGALIVIMSNDERAAEAAWKRMSLQRGVNAYVLAGGINRWLDIYARGVTDAPGADTPPATNTDVLRHTFTAALGADHPASRPPRELAKSREFTPRAKALLPVRSEGGGCG